MVRCQWKQCGGRIAEGEDRCIMCGRSTDIEREKQIEIEKEQAHGAWGGSTEEWKLKNKHERWRKARISSLLFGLDVWEEKCHGVTKD